MIRTAKISDLPEIKKLTEKCAEALQKIGVFQWNQHYPSEEIFKNDIARNELYVLEEEKLLGIVVLTSEMDKEYIPIKWLTQNDKNLYVHRLATHPEHWGKGIGRKLMDFAENFALKNHFSSIRLDTFSQNTRNQVFYEKSGYTRLGEVFFPNQSEFPFYCYEKPLK